MLYFTGGKIWPLGLDDSLLLTTLLFDLLLLLLDLLLFLLLLWESFSFWLSVFLWLPKSSYVAEFVVEAWF